MKQSPINNEKATERLYIRVNEAQKKRYQEVANGNISKLVRDILDATSFCNSKNRKVKSDSASREG